MFPDVQNKPDVFNKPIEHYDVHEALGNPVKILELWIIAPNGFLTRRSITGTKRHPEGITFTDELRNENKFAGLNTIDVTVN